MNKQPNVWISVKLLSIGWLLLVLPCFALAQNNPPLGGRLCIFTGLQLNIFANVRVLEGPTPMDKLKSLPGPVFDLNYVVWRKTKHELFAGLQWSRIRYERKFVPDLGRYAFFGYYQAETYYGTLISRTAQIGYRYWLEQEGKLKMAAQLGLLLNHNDLSAFMPNAEIETNTFTPALRLGNLIRRGKLLGAINVSWQPFPVFRRTFDWEANGSPYEPSRSGRAKSSHGQFLVSVAVGLRL